MVKPRFEGFVFILRVNGRSLMPHCRDIEGDANRLLGNKSKESKLRLDIASATPGRQARQEWHSGRAAAIMMTVPELAQIWFAPHSAAWHAFGRERTVCTWL
jgi:hypothetical protein